MTNCGKKLGKFTLIYNISRPNWPKQFYSLSAWQKIDVIFDRKISTGDNQPPRENLDKSMSNPWKS